MGPGLHHQTPVAVVNVLHGGPGGHYPVHGPEDRKNYKEGENVSGIEHRAYTECLCVHEY